MRNFKEEYQRWLDSPALSEAEWQELKAIEEAILEDEPLAGDLSKHAAWVEELKSRCTFTLENTEMILKMEVGKVFAKVLTHAGVFKRTPEGEAAFDRFVRYVNSEV